MRVSEKVTVQEVNSWQEGDIITIKAGCGAGKSYFIKNNLYAIAKRDNKKILMLIHRSNCVNQFREEIHLDDYEKLDFIDIRTYQDLETKEKNKNPVNLNQYGYIICDEFHYFMTDASFNKFTDLSLNQILAANNQIRIFMSATGDYMTKYICNVKKYRTNHYELPIDYSFITQLEFFNQYSTIDKYIDLAIQNNVKGIFFIKSAKMAYEYHMKYPEHSIFNCGKSHKLYKYVDKEKINNMLKNEKFDKLLLFTTTCMDAGVNIIDDDVHDIVVDVGLDIGQIVQCIGRKRLKDKKDFVNVFIKSVSNQQLGGEESKLKRKVEMADFFKSNDTKAYAEKYYREVDINHIVYDQPTSFGIKKKLNDLMYFNVKIMLLEIEKMKMFGVWGFCKYVADYLGVEYMVAEDETKKLELEIYLEKLSIQINGEKQKLFKEQREELIRIVGLKDARGRIQKSLTQINAYFEANKIKYRIISEKDNNRKLSDGSDNPNRNKIYWRILY